MVYIVYISEEGLAEAAAFVQSNASGHPTHLRHSKHQCQSAKGLSSGVVWAQEHGAARIRMEHWVDHPRSDAHHSNYILKSIYIVIYHMLDKLIKSVEITSPVISLVPLIQDDPRLTS